MMNILIRDKHFDVLIINRTENMTSVDCITQSVDESEVNRKKSDLQLRKEPSSEEKTVILENSSLSNSKTDVSLVVIKTLCEFRSLNHHSFLRYY